jgi:hypothetical protein
MPKRPLRALARVLLFILALLVLVPLIRYRTLSPCGMLEKELIRQAEQEIDEVGVMARDRASEFGDQAEEVVGDVGQVVEDVAGGVAHGLVRARVRRMSTRECVAELTRVVF